MPAIALAFTPVLDRMLLGREQRERLAGLGDVLDPDPLGDLADDRAAGVLARTEVLLTGWGCPRLDAAVLDRAPRLALVAHAAGTVKDFVTPEVFGRGIRVTSAAWANAVPVAEFTVAVIVLAHKRAFLVREDYRRERVGGLGYRHLPVGNRGRRVGIISASRVGRMVIERLRDHEVEVVVWDPFLTDDDATALGARRVELDELLSTADVVSLHAPLLPETTGMIGARELGLLRDGATFVNTARGAIVDEDALVAELSTGRISAVIDTTTVEPLPPDHPLYDLDNVFLTPHIAGSQGLEVRRMTDLALDEIERFAAGRPLEHEVTADDVGRIA